jgi:periplasmic copper chaperone A
MEYMTTSHLLRALASAAFALAATVANAQEFSAGDLRLSRPFSLATPPGASVAVGFMSIENKGATADKLLSATADVSAAVELHTMSMEGGTMRMRQVPSIEIPARGKVELKSGGLHIMFIGLKQGLKDGGKFPVTLKFERAGELKVEMVIEKMGGGHHDHKH